MDPIPGKISSLAVSTDGGTTFTPVLGRVDMTLNVNRGEIDASHMDGGSWANYVMGRRDWTIDGTLRYIEEDEGQAALIDQAFADEASEAEIDVQFRLQEGDGLNEFTGKAFVTALSPAPSDEAPTDMSFTLRGNGPLAKSAQADGGGGVEG